MNAACEAQSLVEVLAGPQRLAHGMKATLARVARLTGIGERRIKALWYAEAKAILAEEMDALRAAARQVEAKKNADHRARLARELREAAERLAVVDEAFFQSDISAMRARADELCRLDHAPGLNHRHSD